MATPGSLSISTNPTNAHIMINEDYVGLSPLNDLEYKTGIYNITILSEGLAPFDTAIFVRSGVPSELAVDLIARKGEDVASNVSGLEIVEAVPVVS